MGCSKQRRNQEFAVMVGAPVAGAVLGFTAATGDPEEKPTTANRLLGATVGLVLGGLVGVAAAALIDSVPEKPEKT